MPRRWTRCSPSWWGSSIAFDCFPRSVVDGTTGRREGRVLRKRVARSGEPFRFGLDEEEIVPFLKLRGFSGIETVTPAQCKEAWFHGTNKKIVISDIFRFVHATHYQL